MPKNLNDRQRRFVAEYLIDLNAVQAAIRAGYAEDSARSNAFKLMKRPDVSAAVDAAMAARARRTKITQDRVLEELALIAFCDPAAIAAAALEGPADIGNLPAPARRLIAGWRWDAQGHFIVRLHSKLRALETIGRHLGLFVDHKRVDVTGRVGLAAEPVPATTRWLDESLENILENEGGDAPPG